MGRKRKLIRKKKNKRKKIRIYKGWIETKREKATIKKEEKGIKVKEKYKEKKNEA